MTPAAHLKAPALSDPCPCCSGRRFGDCCAPFLYDGHPAATALALMRSRYCAYTLQNVDYLLRTQCSVSDPERERDAIRAFAASARFQHLQIIDSADAWVEFKAYFRLGNTQELLHERSRFTCKEGNWCYLDGELYESAVVTGRNDSCFCGSGKKYKKCCGA